MEHHPDLLHEWLRWTARRDRTKEALVCGQERWSYGRLDACSDRFAESLLDMTVTPQDRVVIMLDNCPEAVIGLFGTLKAGGVFVLVAGNTRARRLRYVLDDSQAKVLVANVNRAAAVAEALQGCSHDVQVIWVGQGNNGEVCQEVAGRKWQDLCAHESESGGVSLVGSLVELPRCIDLDLAAILYTSATTGQAKGVMCSHRSMIAAAKSILTYIDNREDDVVLNVLPLSFGYGLYQVLMACMVGFTVVLERSFLYPHITMQRIAQEHVTGFPLVPSMAAMLLRMKNIDEYDFRSLRYITSAGAALPVGHLQRLRQLVPQATVFNMYGLTECVRVCFLSGAELDRRPASVGRPMPNCEVRIVDEYGDPVAPGEAGELIIRGANVMQGYWRDREMTDRTFRSDGETTSRWLYSGDYFRTDEAGYLYFLARRDDLIKTRGERVSPREVEDVICELAAVRETAVIGVPDEVLGQAIKAFIVCDEALLEEKAILRHCLKRLEPLMVPKHIEFVAALPKTERGKINRRELQTVLGEG